MRRKQPNSGSPDIRVPKLQREREVLVRNTVKQETWPREKSELLNKYIKYFAQFINSIDVDKL